MSASQETLLNLLHDRTLQADSDLIIVHGPCISLQSTCKRMNEGLQDTSRRASADHDDMRSIKTHQHILKRVQESFDTSRGRDIKVQDTAGGKGTQESFKVVGVNSCRRCGRIFTLNVGSSPRGSRCGASDSQKNVWM